MLEVKLPGQFDLRLDGKPIAIPARARHALVAYSLLDPGSTYRRAKSAGLLWLIRKD